MSVEEQVMMALRELPPERKMEILDFAEFLKKRVFQVDKEPRPFGLCAGAIRVPDDFDAPLPEGFLESVMGGWQGEPLVREYEGDYEQRDNLA